MECPFCNISTKNRHIIQEGKNVVVILSNPRLMPGHLLVVPRRHVEKIAELKKEEQEELMQTTIDFQEKIIEKVAVGCDIRQNYRPFQKQSNLKVNHLHIHLQPRKLYDELYEKYQKFETNMFKEISPEEAKEITKKLLEK